MILRKYKNVSFKNVKCIRVLTLEFQSGWKCTTPYTVYSRAATGHRNQTKNTQHPFFIYD